MPFLYILILEGAGGGGWTFTAQKSAGNHTPSPPSPHSELLCAMNLSVLEQLFKSRSLGYRFLAVIAGL